MKEVFKDQERGWYDEIKKSEKPNPEHTSRRLKHLSLGIPFFINKLSGHLRWNYIFILSHLMCFTWSVCVLLFLLCYFLNKLDPSILVWVRDTLRFFMWIVVFFTYICWVFLSSYFNAFSSCFSCISCSKLLVLVEKYSITSLLFVWRVAWLMGWFRKCCIW